METSQIVAWVVGSMLGTGVGIGLASLLTSGKEADAWRDGYLVGLRTREGMEILTDDQVGEVADLVAPVVGRE